MSIPGCGSRCPVAKDATTLSTATPTPSTAGMYFYCPQQNLYARVSKVEIGRCSEETRYFIRGYLSGNEPPPPRDADVSAARTVRRLTWYF